MTTAIETLFPYPRVPVLLGVSHKAVLDHKKCPSSCWSADSTVLGWAGPGLQRQEELGDSSKPLSQDQAELGLALSLLLGPIDAW